MTLLLLYAAYVVVLHVVLARRGLPVSTARPWTPPTAISKILVIGATGGTGRALVQQAPVSGQDAVVCTLGHRRYFYPSRILSIGTRHIVRAMQEARVQRLICQTSLGIGHSVGRLGLYYTLFVIPVVLPIYFLDKARQERLVAGSGTAWTLVRPVALTNAAGVGRCQHGDHVGSYLLTRRVARADVARFLLDQLSGDGHVGRAVGVSS